jgi:hypothetical protein
MRWMEVRGIRGFSLMRRFSSEPTVTGSMKFTNSDNNHVWFIFHAERLLAQDFRLLGPPKTLAAAYQPK